MKLDMRAFQKRFDVTPKKRIMDQKSRLDLESFLKDSRVLNLERGEARIYIFWESDS